MSFMLLGILNAQAAFAGLAYRLQTLGGTLGDYGESIALDSSGNIYVFGQSRSAGQGGNDFLLVKYNSAGVIEWQRTLGSASSEQGFGVAVDSSNNVYVTGPINGEGAGGSDALIAKYDGSGTLQWQRVFGGAETEQNYGVRTDSSNNVYIVGYTPQGAGGIDALIAKYNSSGTFQWQRILGLTSFDRFLSIAIDTSDNLYALGFTYSTGAGGNDFLLAKYNSSGTIQWQRVLGGTGSDNGYSVATDSSGNVYAFGYTGSTGAGSNDFLIAKYNSSGTIQWQRVLGGTGSDIGRSVAVDSSDNLYLLGYTGSTGEGAADFLIAKYNSSGTIQWQRVLGGAGSDEGHSIALDSSDNVYVFGPTFSTGEGDADFFLGVLPNDGSLTGTYVLDSVNMVYAASTLTAATSTLTAATSSLTAATSTLTSATATQTSASASLTEHRVDLEA
jgi:uncharacterized delta-60 repeat protein